MAKKKIIGEYMAETGVGCDDDSLHPVDLEYHNIDPENSKWLIAERAPSYWVDWDAGLPR